MNSFGFYLLTDTHYFEASLGAEGTAFDEYMRKEQYFMKETDAIIKSVFKRITDDKETDIVIIPGDLSKNGEKESHKSFLKCTAISDTGMLFLLIKEQIPMSLR